MSKNEVKYKIDDHLVIKNINLNRIEEFINTLKPKEYGTVEGVPYHTIQKLAEKEGFIYKIQINTALKIAKHIAVQKHVSDNNPKKDKNKTDSQVRYQVPRLENETDVEYQKRRYQTLELGRMYQSEHIDKAIICGIDLGALNNVSISDINGNNDYKLLYRSRSVYKITKKYIDTINSVKSKSHFKGDLNSNNRAVQARNEFKKKLYKIFKNELSPKLKETYGHANNIVFVVGVVHDFILFDEDNQIDYGFYQLDIMYDVVKRVINETLPTNFTGYQSVYPTDETATSITCPSCENVNDKNRKKASNRFRCRACGFEDDSSDYVAAINIANRFLEYRNCYKDEHR